MTEKRFYYNTFYHRDDMSRVLEYEIIDRQSYPNYPHYDEKEDIPQWYIYIGENDSVWQDMLVDLLNAIHEENEQLKCGNKNLKAILNDFISICNRLQANPNDKQTLNVARDMLQNMGVDLK